MGPPLTPGHRVIASPTMFPSLQFNTPDIYSNSPFQQPQTAPSYPQQRLFWDGHANMNTSNGLQPYQDPFAMTQGQFDQPFGSSSTIIPSFGGSPSFSQSQSYDLPAMSQPMSASYIDGAAFPAPFSTSPRTMPPQNDNPSMFLSSPARRFGNAESSQPQTVQSLARDKPAYHHQIEESRREREAKRARKTDVRHPSVTRSVMEALRRPVSPVKDSRPGLKRSLTHSGVGAKQAHLRQQSHVSFLDTASNGSGSTARSRNGRSSPLKNLTDSINRQNNSSRNSNRTSLSLTIDENGVAKTVIKENMNESDMDMDDSSSDSGTSSRDDGDFEMHRSQQNSFAFPEEEEYTQPTHIAPSRLQGHSKSSSYSTMTSSSSAWQSSKNSSTYSRGAPLARGHPPRKPAALNGTVEVVPTGDAQQALKAILQDRPRSTSTVSSRQSVQFNSSPPIHQNNFSTFNASPTTITDPDLGTPSTDRESYISNGSTRCVCSSNTPESASLMIQWYG